MNGGYASIGTGRSGAKPANSHASTVPNSPRLRPHEETEISHDYVEVGSHGEEEDFEFIPYSQEQFDLPTPDTSGGMRQTGVQTEPEPMDPSAQNTKRATGVRRAAKQRRRPATRAGHSSDQTKLRNALMKLLVNGGRTLSDTDREKIIEGISQTGETLKSGQRAVEGFIGAFGGAGKKGRDVAKKGKAFLDPSSSTPMKERGKQLADSVKALIKDKVIKKGAIIGGLTALGVVVLAVLCVAATYPILKAAIRNGTAGNPKSLGTSGAAPLVYTLPPAYGSTVKSNNNNSQYSQIG